MNLTLHIKAEFDAVFLLNGLFCEQARSIRHSGAQVLYITVLPLSAVYLPYTVKLAGETARSNGELTRVLRLSDSALLLRLLPRYNYVYTAKPADPAPRSPLIPAFFDAVKKNELSRARAMMTYELSASVEDGALLHFFAEFSDIVYNDGYVPAPDNSYFLFDEAGKNALFVFHLKNNLIDDITENGG
ncbi:MAG: hypothetical protein LBH24_02705 [Clostridiales bacterium]|jgi:hypothetical protein|nr:hypothetical protein [Clostridiales bacterium]